jgi:hypothetical protein
VSWSLSWDSCEFVASRQGLEHRRIFIVRSRYEATTSGDRIRLRSLSVCSGISGVCRLVRSLWRFVVPICKCYIQLLIRTPCLVSFFSTLVRNISRSDKYLECSVGIATGYGLDGRGIGVRFPVGVRIFFSPRPPIQRVMEALSPEIKRPGRESDHSTPASVEIKNTWIYTSTPPYVFMA